MWDKDSPASAEVIERRLLSSAIIMSARRDALQKTRQEAPMAAGPLRHGHKAVLKKIWDERPCLPSVTSRKAWASARGLDPTAVNRWFYAQLRRARVSGFELDTENEGYNLEVDDESPVEGFVPSTPLERDSILHSTTPEGLPELSCYEYSIYSETGLRIPLSPGQSSSPIFGSSFYSPELILDSSSSAYGHLAAPEQFLSTPPSPLKRKRAAQSRSHSQHFMEGRRTQIHQSTYPLPASPAPNNRLPPSPLAPRKPRPPRGTHDILNFRIQDYPCLRSPTPPPTSMPSGYSVPYRMSPRERKEDDEPNLSTFSGLRAVVAKNSRPIGQKQGGCIGDDRSLSHGDNQATTPFPKCLWTISVLCAIVQMVCLFQLPASSAPIKTCIDPTTHLPSQAKRRWLHRVHRRPTNSP